MDNNCKCIQNLAERSVIEQLNILILDECAILLRCVSLFLKNMCI